MVAKMYQSLAVEGEPFTVSGHDYIKVRDKHGNTKSVRWYSEAEYNRLYGASSASSTLTCNQKHALGFDLGYITIFKGNTFPHEEWFESNPSCRFARPWGWYVPSTEPLPEHLPRPLTLVQLPWDEVKKSETELLAEEVVEERVRPYLYDADPSQYVGKVGERRDLTLTVERINTFEDNYGTSTMYVMRDASRNCFVWTTTSSKTKFDEGQTYNIRGTVKEFKTYKGIKQTYLTRCALR